MMKYILWVTLLGSIVACQNDTNQDYDIQNTNTQDESAIIKEIKPETKALLENPFDLYAFKTAKGSSNSGGASKEPYFKELEEGQLYYQYFFFQNLKPDAGVVNKNPIGLVVSKNVENHDYDDKNEAIIAVYIDDNDQNLPELAFVGKEKSVIINQLGQANYEDASCLIYTHLNNTLIIKIEKEQAVWLKYIRMNAPFVPDINNKEHQELLNTISVW